jgi:transcriptional regulator with XRE-family HTH domain
MVYYSNLPGEKIKLLRESFNLSQTKFAAKLNVTKGTVLCWENGKRKVPEHQAAKIAELFEIPENWFFDNDEAEPSNPVLKKDFVFPFETPAQEDTAMLPASTMGERIKLVRERNKMSAEDFAKAVGVRTNTVRRWEQDKFTTSTPKLMKISELFNVPVKWLAEGTGADSNLFIEERTNLPPAETAPLPANTPSSTKGNINEDIPAKHNPDKNHFDALYSSLSEYRRGMVFGYLIAQCNEEMMDRGGQPTNMYKI